jgi:hypothetical protein
MQKQTSWDDSAVTAIRFVDDRDFLATSLSRRTQPGAITAPLKAGGSSELR